ncbi:DUF6816 family protein [Umezakia ovalisporum]|uniref:DUF6816 domain-containing protein n=2 Tax=Umezakia ovalisporum TaxID=75695 RepID=A0AA43GWV8_9CYAN|nr:hypothetical protein [Umezakia ovalisporum]MBI1242932.1 hypothetical protein [Nostoc sp. RI_552]MDH6058760.1 hypothetical protein [Umezakia ovalisporum FSS-43]MDH6063214.1 hypothetical protein [Umezakia ovalisporum FSS-62]MDH6068898.1 hypothetical protein [Umezakia ovalisporum APH033B]MDH6072072.1 hypothetical protein [Umezakia ovalisporum CobakiLakeA]
MLTMRAIWSFGLVVCCLVGWAGTAMAGELSQRLANFPEWEQLTSVRPAEGDLVYPDWMAGSWQVTSTLVDLVAPLAPDVVTPGFESNRQQLNQPVSFLVRFIKVKPWIPGLKLLPLLPKILSPSANLVADRTFNSLNLARAYLGEEGVLSVKVDPDSPNRQITFLGGDRQLVSIITARATEKPSEDKFISSEVFQQLFKGGSFPYFNVVESTTAYQKLSTSEPAVVADQITAVYLSPQDPDYFTAGSRPVALYRYRLEFSRPVLSTTHYPVN